jgi:capsular exopolysaccharide synthesis family protein
MAVNAYPVLRFVRRWLPLLLFGPLGAGAIGYLLVRQLPSVYEANVIIMVQSGDAVTSGSLDPQSAQDLTQTYAEAIHTRPVLTKAAAQAGLTSLRQSELDGRVQARRITGTQLLRVSATDTDPELAARFANAVVQEFIDENAAIQAGRYASSRENLGRLVDQLQADIDAHSQRIDDLRSQSPSTQRDTQLAQLQNDLTQLQAAHGAAVRSYEDLRVNEARGRRLLTVLDPAVPPEAPVRPNRASTTLLATSFGLVAAIGIALLVEYLDDSMHDRQRIAAATGLTTLGIVPRGELGNDLSSTRLESQRLAESYQLLRANLLFAAGDNPIHSVLITSAAEGDGKSTIAANLAVVLAEAGHRVILVDADLRRPSQARLFSLSSKRGLSSLILSGEEKVADLLHEISWLSRLRVLPAGPTPADPSAVLSSTRAAAVLIELRTMCDVLVIDTPPLLGQPDAALLSSRVETVLYVINASRSRGRQAALALEMLRSSGATIAGAVVNRIPRTSVDQAVYDSYEDGRGDSQANPATERTHEATRNGAAARIGSRLRSWSKQLGLQVNALRQGQAATVAQAVLSRRKTFNRRRY